MGWPVAHSRSPSIHNYWIKQHGLNGAYVLLPTDPANLKDALKGLSALGFAGCNLTIPQSHGAAAGGPHQRHRAAHGRDQHHCGRGGWQFERLQQRRFWLHPKPAMTAKPDWQADAGPVLVMGSGGAARAVIVSLAEKGAKDIRVCNRTDSSAADLAPNSKLISHKT